MERELALEFARVTELARLQAYFVRMDQQVTQQRDSLLYILNDVQTEILQVETDRMIYTIKQVAYCMPTETVLKGRLYDNWVKAQLLDCQYKELPKSQQLTAMISFKIGIGDESSSIENDGLIGDGQGVFKPRSMQGVRQVLKKEPAEVTYEIVFARGGLEDEAVLTVSLGE